jgi:hypothetical protein
VDRVSQRLPTSGGWADVEVVPPPPELDAGSVGCGYAGVVLDGGCGDLETDPHNCGRCGHDCDGGSCVSGTCAALPPGTLATGQYTPTAIAVDATDVYWINAGIAMGGMGCCKRVPVYLGGQLLKCSRGGCGNRPTVLAGLSTAALAPALLNPYALTLDATNVYFTDGVSILACAKTGCGCAPRVVGLVEADGLAVSGGTLLYTQTDDGLVGECPTSGCTGTSEVAIEQAGPQGITTDDASVYWTTESSIHSCPLGGCGAAGPSILWNGVFTQANTTGIAQDSEGLYWTNAQPDEAGSVLGCRKSDCGGTLVTFVAADTEPRGIASDGANVYWADSEGLRTCPVTGCDAGPHTLATSAGVGVALGGTTLCFTDPGSSATNGRVVTVGVP